MRHEARLGQREKDGRTKRQHLESVADKLPSARAALDGPEIPDALAYLADWARELYGRSGVDMAGLSPLRFTEVEAWARLTGRRPRPHEIHALVMLDAVMRFPDAED